MRYNYYLKDSNNAIFSLVSDRVDIDKYLQKINGVYKKLVWVLQKDLTTKTTKEFLVHNNNGFITEYCLMYKNGKKIN